MQSIMINDSGFTLIELLVAISIIAVLIALSAFGFQGVFENSRDTQRKSDLKQYQAALENYANKNNGRYPLLDNGGSITAFCTELGLGTNTLGTATACPEDPLFGQEWYYYNYNSDAAGTYYTLSTKLEGTSTSTFFVVCSNGKSGSHPIASFNTQHCPF